MIDNVDGAEADGGALPNLVIIGAMKCGTTSLHLYLDRHPQIAMSRVKEINYFLEGHGSKGVPWYMSHFRADAPVRGESSTSYTKYPQRDGVPARMHALLPEAKLIYILRDPVERTISQYVHDVQRNRERQPLADALRPFSDNRYIDPSRYYTQLQRYLEFYPLSQILVLTAEDLQDDAQGTLNKVVEFLGLTPHRFEGLDEANVSERRGRSPIVGRVVESYKVKRIVRRLPRPIVELGKAIYARLSSKVERPSMGPELRQELSQYLGDDMTGLRSLTGQSFDRWSV